jgi:hypothetical protein
MKTLLYNEAVCFYNHYAETIEIALRRLDVGDEVYVVTCEGELPSCTANPLKDKNICNRCIRIKNHILENVLDGKITEVRIPNLINETDKTLDKINDNNVSSDYQFDSSKFARNQIVDLEKDSFVNNNHPLILSLSGAGNKYYDFISKFIKINEIKRAYIWNGRRTFEAATIHGCIQNGVKFKTHISGWKNNHLIHFSNEKEIHSIKDFSKKSNRVISNAFRSKRTNNIILDGNKFYESQIRGAKMNIFQFNSSVNKFNSVKPLLVIFPSSPWETYGMSEYKNRIFEDQYEGIKAILSLDIVLSNYNVIVRWHPNLRSSGNNEINVINEIIKDTDKKCYHYSFDDTIDSYELINLADKIITFGSTIGAESSYLQKPVISLAPAQYDEFDITYRPKTIIDIIELLKNSNLKPKKLINVFRFGFVKNNPFGIEYKYLSNESNSDIGFKFENNYIIPFDLRIKATILRLLVSIYAKRKNNKCIGKILKTLKKFYKNTLQKI